MIMNTVKYDTNKRWVIHNFNQHEMSNPWLFRREVIHAQLQKESSF
jgi:hypothetical protein